MRIILLKFMAIILASGTFLACKKDATSEDKATVGPDLAFYALTDDNKLLEMNANNTGTAINSMTITGLLSGEKALSIDFRPATGELYLLSSTSVLYKLDPATAMATIISTTQFDPKIDGNYAGIDFNPTVDRIRLVSNTGQNLRLHPETGVAAATDGPINGVTNAAIAAVAYTNSFAGATETALFDIDASTDKLYKQMPPNNGTLVEVGDLGINVSGTGGFDIVAKDNVGIAALTVGSENNLYGINLTSGAATSYGSFPGNTKVIGIAIPIAVP